MSNNNDTVNILPAPSNPPQEGGGLNSGLQQGPAGAFHVPGPQIPNQETLNSLGAPLVRLSKEELQKRQEELNK
ncbi:hypothetical protein BDV93DRAFT_524847 [Ceratobasidium sp. AG-I]|nr:hypothetical protein BDV93DRAFT_524847 [Ceratobasidium sp. AG-I]